VSRVSRYPKNFFIYEDQLKLGGALLFPRESGSSGLPNNELPDENLEIHFSIVLRELWASYAGRDYREPIIGPRMPNVSGFAGELNWSARQFARARTAGASSAQWPSRYATSPGYQSARHVRM
jgi:hypothetical protein